MKMLTKSVGARNGLPLVKRGNCGKPNPEMRPVTATLDCPVILDITFLKKLDMTSFTKKGLMAISRICGISLVKRTEERKTRKRFKRQSLERAKKTAQGSAANRETGEEPPCADATGLKWTAITRIPKIKISSVGRTSLEGGREAPLAASEKSASPRARRKDAKPSVDDIIYGSVKEVVAEPCKTCGRSEQPERFHSHPRKLAQGGREKTGKKAVSKEGKCSTKPDEDCTAKEEPTTRAPKSSVRRHSTGLLTSETCPRLDVGDFEPSFHSDHEIESIKMSHSDGDLRFRFDAFHHDGKALHKKLTGKSNVQMNSLKKGNAAKCSLCGKNFPGKDVGTHEMHCSKSVSKPVSEDGNGGEDRETVKYVTGCYVCGVQIAAKHRAEHEERCIGAWRKQNAQLPPDKRKAEPLRPDYRFTAAGEVDFEGSFDSIWANHRDSLVPCGKCGRTFFPGRVEKHEACCSGQPVRAAHKTLKNK